jgi:hypothetical protein
MPSVPQLPRFNPKPRIVSAVAIATGRSDQGKLVEAAIYAAVQAAQARGVDDPEQLRAIILEARDKAVNG